MTSEPKSDFIVLLLPWSPASPTFPCSGIIGIRWSLWPLPHPLHTLGFVLTQLLILVMGTWRRFGNETLDTSWLLWFDQGHTDNTFKSEECQPLELGRKGALFLLGLLSLWNISPELPWNIFASMPEQPIESRVSREESTKERGTLDIRIQPPFRCAWC